jgi:mono/diheme cytochrome c family protein
MSRKKKHSGGSQRPAQSAAGLGSRSGREIQTAPEGPEPTAGSAPTPVWMFALLALLVYVADIYVVGKGGDLMGKAGSFPAQLYDPYMTYADLAKANPANAADIRDQGRLVFQRNCQQCHQATGMGMPGQFPPLTGSEWVLAEGPNRIIRVVLNGFTGPVTVKGVIYNNNMFAFRDLLSDQDVAAVLTFVRSEWGNTASPVKPEEVKRLREATTDRGMPWTEAELLKFPLAD